MSETPELTDENITEQLVASRTYSRLLGKATDLQIRTLKYVLHALFDSKSIPVELDDYSIKVYLDLDKQKDLAISIKALEAFVLSVFSSKWKVSVCGIMPPNGRLQSSTKKTKPRRTKRLRKVSKRR